MNVKINIWKHMLVEVVATKHGRIDKEEEQMVKHRSSSTVLNWPG